ncbi:MAG: hypothetical protein MJY63_01965 [Paludibacteraceae bacterium]|nr:hypothetical protein [Paludibacteraceae bacterium]
MGKRSGSISTSDLIAELVDVLQPDGKDAQLLSGRNDSYFSQKVRNLKAHKTLEKLGFASVTADGWKFTSDGQMLYDRICQMLKPAFSAVTRVNLQDYSHPNLLTALRTKPFLLLAGISGTGKSRIVRELAFASCPSYLQDNDGTTPGNYCMIEVKPNWHDSTELLGYYSNISKKYIFTKFVKFLVKAKLYHDVPFFVCLDEMNLAPVEQYFAEYLSVLETRKKAAGNEIKTGSLISSDWFTKSYENSDIFEELGLNKIGQEQSAMENEAAESKGQEISTEKYENQNIVDELKAYGLTLPDNVFVIGTVNMDDTTHQFSRKVIDRAMTIEMNGGKLMDMFGGSAKLTYPADDADVASIDLFRPKYVNADEVLADHQDCAEEIKNQTTDWLNQINSCLKNTPFEVSYRVLNELVIYLGNLLDDAKYQGDGTDDKFKTLVNTAVDKITLMKILPRIEGDEEMFTINNDSQNKLEKLQDLFKEIKSTSSKSGNENKEGEIKEEDEQKVDDAKEEGDNGSGASEEKYCESYVKLGEMIERLENGFTRFWP